jgi:protein-export chaperone SecB
MAKAAKSAPRKPAAKATNGGGKRAEEKEPKISEGKSAGAVNLQVPPPQPGTQPSMRILGQYLKDLSFENPNAPQALAPQQSQPDINIAVNVNARNLAPTDFEVELHLDAKATLEGKVIFASELLFAGVFRMENFPAADAVPVRAANSCRCNTQWRLSSPDA